MRGILSEIKYYSDKRFSTLAGTLVYFLLMSVTPFLFWVTLLIGEVDFSEILSYELFSAVAPVLEYLQASAAVATSGAGIILLVTSLWSSTNFFYHLRRSGEIIYDNISKKNGVSLRLTSLLAVLISVLFVAMFVLVPFLSINFLQIIMPEYFAQAISFVFLAMAAFFVAYLLNVFACPYKLGFENTVAGAMLTVILWIICAVGFSIYLQFANPQKLYGAVTAIIVFLLWCYLMINSLILGIIYNAKYAHLSPFYTAATSQRTRTNMARYA